MELSEANKLLEALQNLSTLFDASLPLSLLYEESRGEEGRSVLHEANTVNKLAGMFVTANSYLDRVGKSVQLPDDGLREVGMPIEEVDSMMVAMCVPLWRLLRNLCTDSQTQSTMRQKFRIPAFVKVLQHLNQMEAASKPIKNLRLSGMQLLCNYVASNQSNQAEVWPLLFGQQAVAAADISEEKIALLPPICSYADNVFALGVHVLYNCIVNNDVCRNVFLTETFSSEQQQQQQQQWLRHVIDHEIDYVAEVDDISEAHEWIHHVLAVVFEHQHLVPSLVAVDNEQQQGEQKKSEKKSEQKMNEKVDDEEQGDRCVLFVLFSWFEKESTRFCPGQLLVLDAYRKWTQTLSEEALLDRRIHATVVRNALFLTAWLCERHAGQLMDGERLKHPPDYVAGYPSTHTAAVADDGDVNADAAGEHRETGKPDEHTNQEVVWWHGLGYCLEESDEEQEDEEGEQRKEKGERKQADLCAGYAVAAVRLVLDVLSNVIAVMPDATLQMALVTTPSCFLSSSSSLNPAAALSLLDVVFTLLRHLPLSVITVKVEGTPTPNKVAVDPHRHLKLLFTFKSCLIRFLGNLCYRCRPIQSLLSEKKGLEVFLNSTMFDPTQPFLREWALMALRNATENHDENQAYIELLQNQGVANDWELEGMGLKASLNQNTGKVTIQSTKENKTGPTSEQK